MRKWSLITNHASVLLHIARSPRTTAREICDKVGITERATRKIIADLDATGYISKKKEGRRILYTVNPEIRMRQNVVRDVMVGNFLEVLGWEKVPAEVAVPSAIKKEKKEIFHFYQPPEQKQKLLDEYEEKATELLVL